jgi:hypothetical protein
LVLRFHSRPPCCYHRCRHMAEQVLDVAPELPDGSPSDRTINSRRRSVS